MWMLHLRAGWITARKKVEERKKASVVERQASVDKKWDQQRGFTSEASNEDDLVERGEIELKFRWEE